VTCGCTFPVTPDITHCPVCSTHSTYFPL
jgi:hypothetical protein